MNYRFGIEDLMKVLQAWDELIPGRDKIHLIACGGTALTLMNLKESTKDVDFLVPNEKEYKRLVHFLADTGYAQVTSYGWKRKDENIIFDLYPGNKVYSTELLSSPLKRKGNEKVWEGRKIYLGVLNPIDLMISKMFRGAEVDIQDCLILLKKQQIDFKKLEKRYKETAGYETQQEKVLKNLEQLKKRLKEKENGKG